MGKFVIGVLFGFTVGLLFKLIGLSFVCGLCAIVVSVIVLNWICEGKHGQPRF